MAIKVAEKSGKVIPMKRDIRRYYCPYCGICRSKRALIDSHVASEHKDEHNSYTAAVADNKAKTHNGYSCEECGATFRKPAYLKQHMQGHSVECIALDPI